MRRLVNGVEMDLVAGGVEVVAVQGRLMVQSPTGTVSAVALRQGNSVLVSYRGHTYTVERPGSGKARAQGDHSGEFRAPMPGAIVDVLVEVGQLVQKGDKLVVLEAMKMQQPALAPYDGVVKSIGVAKGDQVAEGALLVEVERADR